MWSLQDRRRRDGGQLSVWSLQDRSVRPSAASFARDPLVSQCQPVCLQTRRKTACGGKLFIHLYKDLTVSWLFSSIISAWEPTALTHTT